MSTTRTGAKDVQDTFADFWATRPRRPRAGRKIAGVAAGIGERYAIDPVLVRVAFAVGTFYGGAGVLLYVLGWLLLPEQDEQSSGFEAVVGQGRSSMSRVWVILLCLAIIPAAGWVFSGPFEGFVGLAVLLGGLFLLHRARADVVAPTSVAKPTEQEPPLDTPDVGGGQPPAWDPLGAAPFAWDLPEPPPVVPDEPPVQPPAARRRRTGLVTAGAALVAAGVCVLLAPMVGGWLTPPHIVGIVLGVLGIGMVAGSLVGGGRGLIGLAVPLSAIGIGMTFLWADGFHGVGDVTAKPTSIDEVQPVYEKSVGDVRVDLSGLPSSGSVHTTVRVGLGDVRVVVPADAEVVATCHAAAGDVTCLDRSDQGLDANARGVQHGSGVRIELDVEASQAGDVKVTHD